jgi:hypothetical protein
VHCPSLVIKSRMAPVRRDSQISELPNLVSGGEDRLIKETSINPPDSGTTRTLTLPVLPSAQVEIFASPQRARLT